MPIHGRPYVPVLDFREVQNVFKDAWNYEYNCFFEQPITDDHTTSIRSSSRRRSSESKSTRNSRKSSKPSLASWARKNSIARQSFRDESQFHRRVKIKETVEMYNDAKTQFTNITMSAYLRCLCEDFQNYYTQNEASIEENTITPIPAENQPRHANTHQRLPTEFRYVRNVQNVSFNGCYVYRSNDLVVFVIPDLHAAKKRLDGENGMLQPFTFQNARTDDTTEEQTMTDKQKKEYLLSVEYRNIWFRAFFYKLDATHSTTLTKIDSWRDLTVQEAKAIQQFDTIYRTTLTKLYFSNQSSQNKTILEDYFNALVEYPCQRDPFFSASYYFKNPSSNHIQEGWRMFNTFFLRQLLNRIVSSKGKYGSITKEIYVNQYIFERCYRDHLIADERFALQRILDIEIGRSLMNIEAKRDVLYSAFECYKFHQLNRIADLSATSSQSVPLQTSSQTVLLGTVAPMTPPLHKTPQFTVQQLLTQLVFVVNPKARNNPTQPTQQKQKWVRKVSITKAIKEHYTLERDKRVIIDCLNKLTPEACRRSKAIEVDKYLRKMFDESPKEDESYDDESIENIQKDTRRLFTSKTPENLFTANQRDVDWSSKLDMSAEMWMDLYYWSFLYDVLQGYQNWDENNVYEKITSTKTSYTSRRSRKSIGQRPKQDGLHASGKVVYIQSQKAPRTTERVSLELVKQKPAIGVSEAIENLTHYNIHNIFQSYAKHLYSIVVSEKESPYKKKKKLIQMNFKPKWRILQEARPQQFCPLYTDGEQKYGFVTTKPYDDFCIARFGKCFDTDQLPTIIPQIRELFSNERKGEQAVRYINGIQDDDTVNTVLNPQERQTLDEIVRKQTNKSELQTFLNYVYVDSNNSFVKVELEIKTSVKKMKSYSKNQTLIPPKTCTTDEEFLISLIQGTRLIWNMLQAHENLITQFFQISDDRCTCVVPSENVTLNSVQSILNFIHTNMKTDITKEFLFMGWRIPESYRNIFCRTPNGSIIPFIHMHKYLTTVTPSDSRRQVDEIIKSKIKKNTKLQIRLTENDVKEAMQYKTSNQHQLRQMYYCVNNVLKALHFPPNSCIHHCAYNGERIPHARIQKDRLSWKHIYGHIGSYVSVDRVGKTLSLVDLVEKCNHPEFNEPWFFDFAF